jgi:hypothetical protein
MKTQSKIPSGRTMRLANDHSLWKEAINIPRYGADVAPGTMFSLGNEAQLTEETFVEPLTTFATGYRDPEDNRALVNYIAPDVQVGSIFEFKKHNNAQEFYTEADDVRAINAEFKRIEYSGQTAFQNTLNKGLGFRYDLDYVRNNGGGKTLETSEQFQQRIVEKILRRLWRNEAVRALTMSAATAVNTNKTWSSGNPNPMADLRAARNLTAYGAATSSGIMANRILWALDAWTTQQAAFEAQNNPLGYTNAGKTPQQIADALLISKGMVSKSVYQSAANAKALIQAGTIVLFQADDAADTEDPTNLKRFWSPTDSGPIRVYVYNHGKFVDVFVELYSRIVATSILGIQQLTVS